MVNLIGANLEEIEAAVAGIGEPRYRARQIYAGIYKRCYSSWDQFTDLGKTASGEAWRTVLALRTLPCSRFSFHRTGHAGTCLRWMAEIESNRSTFRRSGEILSASRLKWAALSDACFCVTGRLPMRRNLSPGEIVGQILAMQADRGTSPKRLNIVIMGMGEPLHNYENLMKAIRLMTDDQGMSISPRHITLSTSGIVPGIRRLAKNEPIPNLAISLNATTDRVRDLLMPINKTMEYCRAVWMPAAAFPLAQRQTDHIRICIN